MSYVIKVEHLEFIEGSSAKEYHIELIATAASQYQVVCRWGRIGSTLSTQTKISTENMVTAQKTYNKILKEKLSKGYVSVAKAKELVEVNIGDIIGGVPSYMTPETQETPAAPEPVFTSHAPRKLLIDPIVHVPQLLNPIKEDEVEKLLQDNSYGCQEKKDGKHMLLHVGKTTQAYNKKGKAVGLPAAWGSLTEECLLDGEAIGNVFHVFDLLESHGEDLRETGYRNRYNHLPLLDIFGDNIKLVPLAVGYAAKKELYDKLVAGKKEGIVFKKLDARYVPGRPASGGNMLKHKFYAEASVRVAAGRQDKHSIGMEVYNPDNNKWVAVGNCTIGQSTPLPPTGSIVEVRYLYAYPGGSLYQPSFKEIRDDVDAYECSITQLKYKAEED